MHPHCQPTGPELRPFLSWLRFLHLRTYGRTHLAIAWRVRSEARDCRRLDEEPLNR